MKVLKIAHGVYPFGNAGVEVYTSQLAKFLVMRGHQVLALVPGRLRDGNKKSTNFEIGFLPDVSRGRFRGDLNSEDSVRVLEDLDRKIGEFRPDMIHLHHAIAAGSGVLDYLDRKGIPFAVTLHDYWFLCPGAARKCGGSCLKCAAGCLGVSPVRFPAFAAAAVFCFKRRQRNLFMLKKIKAPLVVLSRFTRSVFMNYGLPENRFRHISGGVETGMFMPPAQSSGKFPRVGYLGAIYREKGIEVLLEAARRMGPGFRVFLHGPASAGYMAELEKKYAGLYETRGAYGYADLPGVMAGLDVVVLPSLLDETYGLAVQEALAAGKIVVVSDRGALPERIKNGENGFVTRAGDADALAGALREITENFESLRVKIKTRDFAHDISVDAEKHETLYKETAAQWNVTAPVSAGAVQ